MAAGLLRTRLYISYDSTLPLCAARPRKPQTARRSQGCIRIAESRRWARGRERRNGPIDVGDERKRPPMPRTRRSASALAVVQAQISRMQAALAKLQVEIARLRRMQLRNLS